MSLKADIAAWDAKTKADILAVYNSHKDTRGFRARLIQYLPDPALETGASWLIKHHFDAGGAPLAPKQAARFYHALPHLQHWAAKLHAAQCVDHIPIPPACEAEAAAFLRAGTQSDNKFLRAWSYSGLWQLARQFPTYRDEVGTLLLQAEAEETAGSVLARIRKVRKLGL